MNFLTRNKHTLFSLLGLTTIGGLVYYIQFYLHYLEVGVPFPWIKVFFGHFGTYYLLIPFSIPIILITKRFRIKHLFSLNLLFHLIACLVFCFSYLFVAVLYNWSVGFSAPDQSISELYYYAITHNTHIAFIAYWTIVGMVNTFEYQAWYKKSEGERIALVEEINQRDQNKFVSNILVKEKGHTIKIELAGIYWIEAFDNYVKLHSNDRFYLMRKTLSALESQLNPDVFSRIHRSSIVNLSAIKSILNVKNGDAVLTLQTGDELKVSRRFRKFLEQKIGG